MTIGAITLAIYGGVVRHLLMRARLRAAPATLVSLVVWRRADVALYIPRSSKGISQGLDGHEHRSFLLPTAQRPPCQKDRAKICCRSREIADLVPASVRLCRNRRIQW